MARSSLGTRYDTDDSFLELELRPEPLTLTADEIDPKNDPPRSSAKPVEVLVWLVIMTRDGPKSLRVPAMATQWNSRCVWVEGKIRAWSFTAVVWASAVTHRNPKPRSKPAQQPARPAISSADQAALRTAMSGNTRRR